MASLKDIAEKLGLPVNLVSKGINGSPEVDETTRQRILETALAIGYTPKAAAISGKKQRICIFVENMGIDSVEQFGYDIIVGFRLAASERDWDIDIVPIGLGENIDYIYDEYLRKNKYSAGFLLGFFLHSDLHQQLRKTAFPTVILDIPIYNKKVTCVGVDNHYGIFLAVEHLAALGHSTIALMNGESGNRPAQERFQGFKAGMNYFNLPVRRDLIAFGSYTSTAARPYIQRFVETGATAIICASDIIAAGVISELLRLGVKVPQEVSVVGFDDIPLSKHTSPPLTTIRQNRLDVGRIACDAIEQTMGGVPVSRIQLLPSLVIRASTSKVTDYAGD